MKCSIHDPKKCSEFQEIFRLQCTTSSANLDSHWESLIKLSSCYSAKKNTVLLRHNHYEDKLRFLINGLVKVTHNDGETYVYDFRTKQDFLCEISSVFDKEVSKFSFEAITDCEWIEISSKDLLEELKTNKLLQEMNSVLMNRYLKKSHDRHAFLRIHNAENRYRIFCAENPEVIKYAKLGDIASYLGITQQSLSRIRKNCSKFKECS